MTESAKVLAYDVGGSHATAGIVDLGCPSVQCVRSCPIDSNGTTPVILDEIHALGLSVLSDAQGLHHLPDGIALAVPGPLTMNEGSACCSTNTRRCTGRRSSTAWKQGWYLCGEDHFPE